jgi:ribonuclease P protein component
LQRLKTRSQFQAVLAGSTVSRTAHFALHRAELDAGVVTQHSPESQIAPESALFVVDAVWMGAMVPKRWAKRAVTRNTIKRQIYSLSAEFESAFSKAAYVVRLRTGFDRKHFVSATSEALKEAVRLELHQLFARVAVRSPASAASKAAA